MEIPSIITGAGFLEMIRNGERILSRDRNRFISVYMACRGFQLEKYSSLGLILLGIFLTPGLYSRKLSPLMEK